MIPEIREKLNAEFTEEKYLAYVNELNTTYRYPADFRIAETPIFTSKKLTKALVDASYDIVKQLMSEQFWKYSQAAIPERFSTPNETDHPVFLQVDFGICLGDDGEYVPQLIELQGFPSLYGFQAFMNDTMRKHFSIPENYGAAFNGFDRDAYRDLLYRVIVGDEDPAQVVLMEIYPEEQKTRIDFAVMEELIGISTVCLTSVIKKGKKLFYTKDNQEIPIRRIYNRVIFDELERKGINADHVFREEINAEWVGHPNWYFRISKHTLPFLKGANVPASYLLSDLNEYPDDLDRFVLKPLFSFAGQGVDINVSREKLDKIYDRNSFLLQQKVEYAPIIHTPDGPAKAEIRMMFIWDKEPVLVKNLVRLSKGEMMGVDFNKNKTWVGSSISYHEPI